VTPAIDFSQPIPLFPLPQCILLPHATAPLHFFEDRYRALMRDALAGSRLIASAVFAGSAWQSAYEDAPPLRPSVCVGYVAKHEKLPDGRFNLLLQGLCRAQIIDEAPRGVYRTALLRPVADETPLGADPDDVRQALDALLHAEPLQSLAAVRAVSKWFEAEIPTVAAVDLVCMALFPDTELRYAMLAEADPTRRLDRLMKALKRLKRTVEIAERYPPPIDDRGATPN